MEANNPSQTTLTQEIFTVEMNDGLALQILVDGVTAAQQRGAFDLHEAGNVAAAVKHFTKPRPDAQVKTNTGKPEVQPTQGATNEEQKDVTKTD